MGVEVGVLVGCGELLGVGVEVGEAPERYRL